MTKTDDCMISDTDSMEAQDSRYKQPRKQLEVVTKGPARSRKVMSRSIPLELYTARVSTKSLDVLCDH